LAVRRIGGAGGRFMSNSLADSRGVPDRRPVPLLTPGTRIQETDPHDFSWANPFSPRMNLIF
jgi:hypothetical protein